MLPQTVSALFKLLQHSAVRECGHRLALEHRYLDGLNGSDKDFSAEAFRCFRAAAEQVASHSPNRRPNV